MKVACFSDLHLNYKSHPWLLKTKDIVRKEQPDVVVISGDIFDDFMINPYKELSKIDDIPIICCLGNHEFAYSSIQDTKKRYEDKYNPEKYNVHYLDIIGKKEIENVNFVGNVLWYDGSLRNYGEDTLEIDRSWLDSTIKFFNFKEENKECVKQINDNLSSDKTNFLVTHCVPHRDLNLFSFDDVSVYNTYSGMDNLFNKLLYKVDYAICGHTHRHVSKEIDGCFCVNIGNDYLMRNNGFQYFIMEVDK